MNKIFISLLLVLSTAFSFAQSELHKKGVDVFLQDYNNSDFEKIYQTFSTEMKNSRSKEYFFKIFTRVRSEYGNLNHLELFKYLENSKNKSRGKYNGSFENGMLTIQITFDSKQQIIGLFFLKDNIYL